MTFSARSLAVTPGSSRPRTVIFRLSGTRSHRTPSAQMLAISLRPMPAPKAPISPAWGVCESEPSTTSPGSDSPSSTSTWWQMPRPTSKKLAMPREYRRRIVSSST